MSLLLLRRLSACGYEEPGGLLPAPEPLQPAQPPWPGAMIFTVVAGMVIWLLAHGYAPPAALGIVTGTGIAAASIISWLAGTQSSDGWPVA